MFGKEPFDGEIEISIAGYGEPDRLFVNPRLHTCGDVEGVTFRFPGEGPWIISLEDLKQIVAQALDEPPPDEPS